MNILGLLRESSLDKMNCVQYYRTYLPLREVDRHTEDINVAMISPEGAENLIWEQFDVVMMARMYSAEMLRAALDKIHEWGGVLVFDCDDDLTETHKLVNGRGPEFCEVLGLVDYITTSTVPLARLFAQHTRRPPVVLKNCVDGEWMRSQVTAPRRVESDRLTLGFVGSPTHWGDWRMPAIPFARILREYRDTVRGTLFGEMPRYLTFAADDLLLFQGVPLHVYPAVLKQFDIVLCAVDVHDEFNVGKSGMKALECMALGVVPICSRFGPYLELEAEGAPVAVIREDSQDGWYEAMRYVISDTEWRQELSAAGPGWVAENRDMCYNGYRQWAEFYRSIT